MESSGLVLPNSVPTSSSFPNSHNSISGSQMADAINDASALDSDNESLFRQPAVVPTHDSDADAEHDDYQMELSDLENHKTNNVEASESPDSGDDAAHSTFSGNDADAAADDADSDVHFDVHDESRSSNSSIQDMSRGMKRKGTDEEEYIRNNPALYGLRRSGRARAPRQVFHTSDSESDAVSRPKRRRGQRGSRAPRVARSQTPESDSESDNDLYAGPRSRSSKSKRRKISRGQDTSAPSHGEVRFSTRRANRVANYNEDADDDIFDDDSEDATPIEWVYTADDNTPAIDLVLNHRLKEGVDLSTADVSRKDYEFYIKWQGKSHYHATWETLETLSGCRSTRRLDNYIRKILSQEILFANEPDLLPEDKEKWFLDRERDLDAIEDYKMVERVIGSRKIDGETQYYVKWKRLVYEYCTWEDAALISQISQTEIDRFLDRCSHPPISNKAESGFSRSKFDPIHGTPSFVQNGELKEFQVKGVNFMAYNWTRGRNVVLADEMGLGKTVQTVAFINWLRHVKHQQGPFIVVVPLSTMPSWAETFDMWTPDLNYVSYNGNEASRNVIKEYELLVDGNVKKPKFHVLLTTYEYVLVDSSFLSQIKWQFMAIDEAHRLKNRDSQLYSKLVEFRAPSRLLITGTPVQNNLGELSALMDFLNPGLIEIDENMDLSSEAASVKLAELTKAIQPYMLRRTKNKVETDLPPKSEKIIRVELSDFQLEYYKNILTKNYAALNQGSKGQKQSLLNIMIELKKASNHPFMFPNAESRILEGKYGREEILRALITSSGKMMLLDQLLAKLKRDGHRVLIFSQMVHMLDILADYMDSRGYSYQRLDGTIAPVPRRLSIEHFNAPDSNDFVFLLSTRAGGLGINLMTADTVVLFDSDWNPQADLQAMARAHRIGQTKPVSVYRLVSKDTVEEEVLERARNKLMLEFITIQRGVTDKEASEIKDKMARAGHHISEPTSTEDISRILKRRGQRMFEQFGNQKKLEELDIDSVLANAEEHKTEQAEGMEADGGEEFLKAFDFVDVKVDDLTWDDIIPKDQLDAIRTEEEKQQNAELAAQEIEKSQSRKRKEPVDSREERRAKRRARVQVNMDADNSDDGAPAEPSRPLEEKEYRHLVRAYLRYGDIDENQEELLKEARLVGRDVSVVKSALQEILDKSRDLVKQENDRVQALEREGKVFTKKERKAVLFDHRGVKRINAETMLDRPNDMRLLRKALDKFPNQKNFRIPEATKGTDYSCSWGAREDGMLCVGIVRHGYGAWTQIRDDPDLGLSDKLFLEEHRVDRKAERERERDKGKSNDKESSRGAKTKSPGAVHLVRRVEYLLSVLKDKMSNGTSVAAKKAVENHHRNNKKGSLHSKSLSSTKSASPVPSVSRKERDSEKTHHSYNHRSRNHERSRTPDVRKIIGSHKSRPKFSREEEHHHHHSHHHRRRHSAEQTNGSAGDSLMIGIFRPARDKLKRLSRINKENIPDKVKRASEIRVVLKEVGSFIQETIKGAKQDRDWLEKRLWEHVTNFWPSKGISGDTLLIMYNKLVAFEKSSVS